MTNTTGELRREELQREVCDLSKTLTHEQKVREYLDRVYHLKNVSDISIPNFIPPKTKEVLGELVLVEREISRLETQIRELKENLKEEDRFTIKSKQLLESSRLKNNASLLFHNNSKVGFPFETNKALHFISKAIKEKDKHHLWCNNDEEVRIFGERAPMKRAIIKPQASLLREPRQINPSREPNMEIPRGLTTDLPPKVMISPLHPLEETTQRWPPNKLSESIMKCLVSIFVRLLRTSRAMEMEKSGTIARSNKFSLAFRTDQPSSTPAAMQKDWRQQDPYSIFDSEDSIPRDIGPYKNLVKFSSPSLDSKCISTSNSAPLFQKLKILIKNLEKVDLRFLTRQQKLAFWINMYNACIMHGFLQYGVPSSSTPEKLKSLLNKATLDIGGYVINAQAIEHAILRNSFMSSLEKEDNKGDKGNTIPGFYGFESFDPNTIFALCCGTRSSPAVKIYSAEGVMAELEKSKLEYLQASMIVRKSAKKIAFPELMLRNMHNFADDLDSLLEWVCEQLPTSGSLRKSMVECFRGIHGGGKASTIVEKIPYDFEFLYLLLVC
ncbi:unnamed protein product [Cuscuta epithymum]|uniref:DUF547 domain-containing protein n=1 Tax=Cuscuta epithymum TaxID=186058 RepID=A0AAV0FKE5_9ASTE|nr:unnamed protein product [Cuscuta epithymum]